jgi:hypothetical protein
MKLSPSIIRVVAIHPPEIKGDYTQDEIERGARLILAAGGTIRPLIVRRAGVENYTLVDGEFAFAGEFVYLCAMYARELDPIEGATIDAYIISPENEQAIMKQLRLLENFC